MNRVIPFVKMHGAGNDFVVLDGLRRPIRVPPALARRLADRRTGVGCDQILVLEPSRKADFRMRVLNADGSEAEMCGNGIRCAALLARRRGHVAKDAMSVETRAGLIRPVLQGDGARVDMGEPVLDAEKIPTRARGRVIERVFRLPAAAGARALASTCVSMGNPHAVIFVDDLDRTPVETLGPRLETDPFFPRRTNVEFVQVLGPRAARVKVWERGAGLTPACGTGACAVGVAGVLTGRFHRTVDLSLPGGTLRIEWGADNRVYMTGPAAFVYEGAFSL